MTAHQHRYFRGPVVVPSILVLLLLFVPRAQSAYASEFNLADARRSVVFVEWIDADAIRVASGSGFIIDGNGLICTNRHVARPGQENPDLKDLTLLVGVPEEKDPDSLRFYHATVVSAAEPTGPDFALLKIANAAGGPPFKALALAAAPAELGDAVVAVGYPLPQDSPALTCTRGMVSATRVRVGSASYWQTDAAINPGNSGGPMLNAAGQVVGLATAKILAAQGMGYVLPLPLIRDAVGAMTAQQLAAAQPEPGPIDLDKLQPPMSVGIGAGDWDVGKGILKETTNGLAIENAGTPLWLTSKTSLPARFKLVVRCGVNFDRGEQVLDGLDAPVARSLCVRFDAPDVGADINRKGPGYLVRLAAGGLWLQRNGEVVAVRREITSPEGALVPLEISCRDGSITVGLPGGRTWLHWDDPSPLPAASRFSIGGRFVKLDLHQVDLIDLDHAPRNSAVTANGGLSTTQPSR